MIRRLITLTLIAGFIYLGATVKLGERTFFGHVANIWRADETQEMVEGVKDKGGPALEKMKRGVEAGWNEVNRADEGRKGDNLAAEPNGGDAGPQLSKQDAADAGAPP